MPLHCFTSHIGPVHPKAIEEFPIIGFYLYHVTSAGQPSNWTTSGIKQLTFDLTLYRISIYRLKFNLR